MTVPTSNINATSSVAAAHTPHTPTPQRQSDGKMAAAQEPNVNFVTVLDCSFQKIQRIFESFQEGYHAQYVFAIGSFYQKHVEPLQANWHPYYLRRIHQELRNIIAQTPSNQAGPWNKLQQLLPRMTVVKYLDLSHLMERMYTDRSVDFIEEDFRVIGTFGQKVKLEKMGTSLNPVVRIFSPGFIKESEFHIDFNQEINDAFLSTITLLGQRNSNGESLKRWEQEIREFHEKYFLNQKLTSVQGFKLACQQVFKQNPHPPTHIQLFFKLLQARIDAQQKLWKDAVEFLITTAFKTTRQQINTDATFAGKRAQAITELEMLLKTLPRDIYAIAAFFADQFRQKPACTHYGKFHACLKSGTDQLEVAQLSVMEALQKKRVHLYFDKEEVLSSLRIQFLVEEEPKVSKWEAKLDAIEQEAEREQKNAASDRKDSLPPPEKKAEKLSDDPALNSELNDFMKQEEEEAWRSLPQFAESPLSSEKVQVGIAETGRFLTKIQLFEHFPGCDIPFPRLTTYVSRNELTHWAKCNKPPHVAALLIFVLKNMPCSNVLTDTVACKTVEEGEFLGQRCAAVLELDTALARKYRRAFNNVIIDKTHNPKCLVSRWIDGRLPENQIDAHIRTKQILELAKYKNGKPDYIQELERKQLKETRDLVYLYDVREIQTLYKKLIQDNEAEIKQNDALMAQAKDKAKAAEFFKENQRLLKMRDKLQDEIQDHFWHATTLARTWKSAQMVALIDLLFGSMDSHSGQFLRDEDGFIRNIDFARFGFPGDAYTSVNATGETEVHAALRSYLLDHPAAFEPLDPDLVELIKEWDLAAIQQEFQDKDLLGDRQHFETAIQAVEIAGAALDSIPVLKEILACYPKLETERKSSYEQFRKVAVATFQKDRHFYDDKIMKKIERPFKELYDFWYNCGGTFNDAVAKLKQIKQKFRKDCVLFMHPRAFDLLLQRIRDCKAYVREEEAAGRKPTVRGIRDSLYYDFALFFKVLERMEQQFADGSPIGPGQAICLTPGFNGLASLDAILKSIISASVASPQEINAMKAAIANLKQNSLSIHCRELVY